MSHRIFFPTSRGDFTPSLAPGQRYRYPFADRRLARRHQQISAQMRENRTAILHRLSADYSQVKGAYRFFESVDLAELIYQTTRLDNEQVCGKDLLVYIDRTSFNLKLGGESRLRRRWAKTFGVIEDNRSPGFFATPALVMEHGSRRCLGLADVLLHTRPLQKQSAKQTTKARYERQKLPFEHRESGAFAIVARQAAPQLVAAQRVSFIMDQGADSYELIHYIVGSLKQDLLLRVCHDRRVRCVQTGREGTVKGLLDQQPWQDSRRVSLRALDHRSKTSGKRVRRKKRRSKLKLRFLRGQMIPPSGRPAIQQPLMWIEVREDPDTVPAGEPPIHWYLLCSWPVDRVATAWQVVAAYQGRWQIEQLFRCTKKQGLDIERTQLREPDNIRKLTVMALQVSAEALQLTQVRDGESFVPIETMFDSQQQKLLTQLNTRLSGQTEKVTNPHPKDSLAWAAWIIARLGGWKGYASQRKPGPITMTRGLSRFHDLFYWFEVDFSP
jgi:hypothetical protein